VTPQPPKPLELFYSYSHKDEELRDQLENHLSMLKREGVISAWHDRRISAGQEWDGEIDEHLTSAAIILLLVSSDFLASNYCYDNEVKRAMERHEAHEARVIPVILRPCDWHSAPFGKVQALPKDAKPVTRWADRDEAFLDIARGIRFAAEEMTSTPHAANSSADETAKPTPHLHIPDILRVAFVARKDRDGKDIVQRLKEELAPNKNRLIALWGAGGVGKTAIAAEAARALVDIYDQRVVWISGEGREDFGLVTLLDGIATQLGNDDLRKLAIDAKKEQVREILTAAPTLVVLDNFETIVPIEGIRCSEWLAQPSLCSSLITTRQNIRAAHRNIPTDPMLADEADALLQRSILEAHDRGAFANLDRERVIETSEANPLVLQWIVRQIDLAQDAEEVLNDLKHGEGTAAERVFDRSFNLPQLDNGGRAVLLALSLFVPSATRKALSNVSGLGKERDRKRFKDAMKMLSSLWLLRTVDAGERLSIEGLTRELTRVRLSMDQRLKSFRQRYVARFLQLAEINEQTTVPNLNRLELEKDNLLNAMNVAFEMADQRSGILLASLLVGPEHMFGIRGYWDESISWGGRALTAAKEMKNERRVAELTVCVAAIRSHRGEVKEARQAYEQALTTFREWKDNRNVALVLANLSMISVERGEFIEARELVDESLAIQKSLHIQEFASLPLFVLGQIAHTQGDWEEAKRLYQESISISQDLQDQQRVAWCLTSLGSLAQLEGDHRQAAQSYDQSLGIIRGFRNQHSMSRLLCNLGLLEQDQGNIAAAQRLLNESLEMARHLGDESGIAFALTRLGGLDVINEKYQDGEKALEEGLSIFRHLGDKTQISDSLETLGDLRAARGSFEEAHALYGESLQIASALCYKLRIASVKHSLGVLAEKQSNEEEALRLLKESAQEFEALGSPKAESARLDLARIEGKSP
jgi:tetratricopeptide (TPR) repeat protein